jgi:hypothetical protein
MESILLYAFSTFQDRVCGMELGMENVPLSTFQDIDT